MSVSLLPSVAAAGFVNAFLFCRRCFIDSQLPGSKSQFMPRIRDEKLHVVIDAFRFHNQDSGEVRLDSVSLYSCAALTKATPFSCRFTSHVS